MQYAGSNHVTFCSFLKENALFISLFSFRHISEGQKKGPFWEQKKRSNLIPMMHFCLELLLPNGSSWMVMIYISCTKQTNKSQKKQNNINVNCMVISSFKLRKKKHISNTRHRNLHRFVPVKTNQRTLNDFDHRRRHRGCWTPRSAVGSRPWRLSCWCCRRGTTCHENGRRCGNVWMSREGRVC